MCSTVAATIRELDRLGEDDENDSVKLRTGLHVGGYRLCQWVLLQQPELFQGILGRLPICLFRSTAGMLAGARAQCDSTWLLAQQRRPFIRRCSGRLIGWSDRPR